MAAQPARSRVVARTPFSVALAAWFAGEFARCVTICDDLPDTAATVLLRARALQRLRRPGDVARSRRELLAAFEGVRDEAAATAQMLLATAEIAEGDVRGGLARLDRLRAAPITVTLRSEVALRRSHAFYVRADLDAASAALEDVSPKTDIIAANGHSYAGWIATRRGDHEAAATAFKASVLHLDTCQHHDRGLEANALEALAHLAAERFDFATWSFIVERRARLDWTADGLALPRFWIAMAAALVYEAQGDVLRALRAAGEAATVAPSPAYRARALLRRALIGVCAGDTFTPIDIVGAARAIVDQIDPATLRGDERMTLLVLAEATARVAREAGLLEPAVARGYFDAYRRLGPMNRVLAMAADPRATAMERITEAAVVDAEGDAVGAARLYTEAFRRYREFGYRRRAISCALRLGAMTGDDEYFAYVEAQTRDLSPTYWARRAISSRARLYEDPVASRLSAVQREVLMLLLAGKSHNEIARERKRALSTIKNLAHDLYAAFGVASKAALMAECARRRIATD